MVKFRLFRYTVIQQETLISTGYQSKSKKKFLLFYEIIICKREQTGREITSIGKYMRIKIE